VTTQGELTMDESRSFQRDPHMMELLRAAGEQADLVTACSAKTLLDLEHFLGHPLARARVIHNGADVRAFAAASPLSLGYPYVLALGRLVPQKGFDVLLRAWKGLRAPAMRLVIAGEGPERSELEDLVASLGVERSVVFFGPSDRATTPRLVAGATAVVVPSRSDEGLPLVSVEAMASGRPLVTTRSGGVVEAVSDGVSGLVVEQEDATGLSGALQRIVDDPALAADLGRAAQRRARDFDWNVLADRYLDAFQCVLVARTP
jgi:glycosyltransferase involved in cell wall biosynthesis